MSKRRQQVLVLYLADSALHHGIWHCGRRNQTGRIRYMYKLRLNPTERQLRLWNTDDLNDPEVARILSRRQPWYEWASGRLEIMQRSKLWRLLTGDESYDTDYWLTRLENKLDRDLASASVSTPAA